MIGNFSRLAPLLVLILFSFFTYSAYSGRVAGKNASVATNDSDLSAGGFGALRVRTLARELQESQLIEKTLRAEVFSVQLFLVKDGVRQNLQPLRYTLKNGQEFVANGQSIACTHDLARATADLQNEYFKVQGNQGIYRHTIEEIKCGSAYEIEFVSTTGAGQALGVWDVSQTAVEKFRAINRLAFWRNSIRMRFPASGDYYSGGTVHVTRGDHWDVVGHELGHAIYDEADIGAWGGGPHRIDECYTSRLALSEGWASFFSAWLKIGRDDRDAQFEYMVPRRAPLRIEHVPEDVCAGQTNEWRVTAFLWDVYDTNRDSEQLEQGMQPFWDTMFRGGFQNTRAIAERLIARGASASEIQQLWRQNFKQQY